MVNLREVSLRRAFAKISDDVLADTEADLLDRLNTQQMLKYGLRYRAGALLNKDQVNNDRFALQFTRNAGPISGDHVARAALVMPHIAKDLNISRPTAQLAELESHPTVKPVQMIADAIKDVSRRGSIVLDLFGGSGSTLIAAHKTGRRGYLVELDPVFCDRIIKRWEDYAKDEAVLVAQDVGQMAVASEAAQ